MRRIVIVHQHTNNFGDDAAGSALLTSLFDTLDPDQIDVFYIWHRGGQGLPTSDPRVRHHFLAALDGTRDRRPELAVRTAMTLPSARLATGDLGELVRACRGASAVIVAPAGSNIGLYKDWTYLLALVTLVRSGVRPIFCQNTVAASFSRPFDALAKYVLKRSTVFVREQASLAYLKELKISAALGVDTALAVSPEDPMVHTRPYLAVIPTRLANWHRDHRSFHDMDFLGATLPDAIADVADAAGFDVRVIAHLYGSEDEGSALGTLRDHLLARGCSAEVVVPESHRAYASALAGARATVSMRYHGLVLSGLAGVPCVALAYENKMCEAARYLRQETLLVDVHTATRHDIRTRLQQAIALSEEERGELAEASSTLRVVARQPVHHLAHAFGLQERPPAAWPGPPLSGARGA